MGCGCGMGGHTPQCMGAMKLILGALIIANAYWNWFGWAMFIGILLVVSGAIKMIMPKCACGGDCCGDMGAMPKKKK
jgi:hypothetical protein